ncbi:MAG: hypothetical protein ACRDKH_06455, partial [Solirubrobacterales bacterium]
RARGGLGDGGRAGRRTGREGLMEPLIALSQAEGYVAGAYLVFAALLLIYLAIMAAKLGRIQRELRELASASDRPPRSTAGQASRREDREIEAARREARR